MRLSSGDVTAVTAVAVAACTGAVFLWRKFLGPLIHGGLRLLEDWNGTPGRPGVPARPGVMASLADIRSELTLNDGDSVKDTVTLIARQLDLHRTTNRLQITGIEDHLGAQDRASRKRSDTLDAMDARMSGKPACAHYEPLPDDGKEPG